MVRSVARPSVHNLVLIAGFALTAFAGVLLIEAWTGDLLGAATGSMIAFNTHTLTRTAQIQGVHLYGRPLTLLATDQIIRASARSRQHDNGGRRTGSWRWAALLAGTLTILAYTSGTWWYSAR